MSAYEGWNDVPSEIFHMVLRKSSEEFCWQLRGVASSWAVSVRSFTKANLVIRIRAEQDTDHCAGVKQLFQFARQRAHQYPNACLIIQTHQPLVPTACVEFLQGLAEQDDGGAHCKLTVTLDLTRVGPDATTAKAISQAALQLGAQGIVTRVSIVDDPVVRTSLSRHIQSEDLNTLAPFLHKLELHPVPALSASTTGHEPFWCNVSLKYSALQQANQSLQALCLVHDFDIGIVRCIAQFGSLRKLHLTLEKSWPSDNCFAQLARLSQLRDLALQCQQCDVSCANVILSNQATLRSITLASCSWSLDTYAALNKASALTVLSVRVEVVTESDARILGNLKTPQSLRLELQRCDQMGWKALRALSSGQAKITFLSLCRMPRDQGLSYWKHVISMPYLTTLIIDAAMGFTGTSMQEQPCLSSLYLADCNDITEQGVAHMVDMFPALHTVLLCHGKKCFNSPFSHDRRVLQRSTFWRCHSGLSADSTSTNALSVRLATVVSYSSGLQVRCNILTNIILEEQTTKTFTCMPGARI